MKGIKLSVIVAALALAGPCLGLAAVPPLAPQSVNQAQLQQTVTSGRGAAVLRAQVLLDRTFISPGVIDSRFGNTTKKALKTFQAVNALPVTGFLDLPTWARLTASDPAPVLVAYRLTKADAKGPFARRIPRSWRRQARLRRLSYTSQREALGEKFHVSPALLLRLNPGKRFNVVGTEVVVPNVAGRKPASKAAKVIVDKHRRAVKAYDWNGRLIAFYPATIGSTDYPAPRGTLKIRAVLRNPDYIYSSRLRFARLRSGETLKIAPGPNNPVGVVWIDLTKDGYGIHGTPDPGKVGKSYSHGCVRLTNWDAQELAGLVDRGTPVIFAG